MAEVGKAWGWVGGGGGYTISSFSVWYPWLKSLTNRGIQRQRERERETRTKRRKYTPTMSEKFSRTLLHIFRDKEQNEKKEKNDMHIQWVITYPDSGTEIQSQRDETEVRITRGIYTRRNYNNHTSFFWNAVPHWPRCTRLFTYMQITDNTPGHWERHRYREIDKNAE